MFVRGARLGIVEGWLCEGNTDEEPLGVYYFLGANTFLLLYSFFWVFNTLTDALGGSYFLGRMFVSSFFPKRGCPCWTFWSVSLGTVPCWERFGNKLVVGAVLGWTGDGPNKGWLEDGKLGTRDFCWVGWIFLVYSCYFFWA